MNGGYEFLQIKSYPNVPRKEKKFINFAKNSLRIYDEKFLAEVFKAFTGPSQPAAITADGGGACPILSVPASTGVASSVTASVVEATDNVPSIVAQITAAKGLKAEKVKCKKSEKEEQKKKEKEKKEKKEKKQKKEKKEKSLCLLYPLWRFPFVKLDLRYSRNGPEQRRKKRKERSVHSMIV